MNENKKNWWVTGLIAVTSILILLPMYMTVMIAVKDPQQMAQSILGWPTKWQWSNFSDAVRMTNFFHAFGNSLKITVSTVLLTLLTNSMVAYAIARNMRRKLFKGLYYYFVSALFVPFPIIMMPLVKQMAALQLNNSVGLVFLYVVYSLAFNIFLYVGYIRGLPYELDEAAKMDGAGVWRTFWQVIFPLMMPINATVGILTCISSWNDFLLPLIILSKQEMATLPLAQYIFQSKFGVEYNLAFASYLMALAPMVIVYVFAQRWVISGVVRGAVKS